MIDIDIHEYVNSGFSPQINADDADFRKEKKEESAGLTLPPMDTHHAHGKAGRFCPAFPCAWLLQFSDPENHVNSVKNFLSEKSASICVNLRRKSEFRPPSAPYSKAAPNISS